MKNKRDQEDPKDHVYADLWITLSEHFLDTETRPYLIDSAAQCVEKGLSLDEVETIFVHEVTPVLRANLLSVAGEWAGFDEEWLCRACFARHRRRQKMSRVCLSLSAAFNARFATRERKVLLKLCALLGSLEGNARESMRVQLKAIAHVVFDFVAPKRNARLKTYSSESFYQRFELYFLPIFDELMFDDRAKAEQRLSAWLKGGLECDALI